MNKKIGLASASFLGLTTILGSGWLFAPYRTAQLAGPAAIFSWIIAMFVILLLSLCLVEVVSRYPIRGLSAVIPFLTHNKYFGFPFAIANWLGVVAVIGLEAEAVIQYLIQLLPNIKDQLFYNGSLTNLGDSLAVALAILFTLMNFWGAKIMAKTNNIFSVIKIIIPLVVALAIIGVSFHPERFESLTNRTFMPYGVGSVFTTILSTGIIIAFNGFQTVASFASEIKNPSRTIGWSIFIALSGALGIYVLLQIAFVGAIPDELLQKGWHGLKMEAPILQLVGMLGLGMLSSMIYFGSVIAPAGSGIVFTGSATRMFTAMARKGQMPSYFDTSHKVYNISRRSLVFNMFLSIGFILIFRSWNSLAQMLTLIHIISYLPMTLAVWALRKQFKNADSIYRLPFGKLISILLFIFFSCLFMQAKWTLIAQVLLVFLVFQVGYIFSVSRSTEAFITAIKSTAGLILFFSGMAYLAYLHHINSEFFNDIRYISTGVLWSLISFFILYLQSDDKPHEEDAASYDKIN